jgi:hypothetical protein
MSACDELRAKAAGVASLPEGDPERAEYLRHGRGCAGCMEALREGEKLMRLIESSPLPAPSPQALQRASAAILSELRAASTGPRRATPRPRWLLQAAAAIPGFLLPLLIARHLDRDGWAAALLLLAVAAVLTASAGKLRAGALVVLAASAGFAFAAGGVPGVPLSGASLHLGELDCPFFELVAAALPFAAAFVVFRRNPMPGALAQAAAAGALAGQAALHLACPDSHNVVHLWFFHVGGVAAAALIGWVLERQLIPAHN